MPDFTKMRWLNEPPEARVSADSLEITTAEASDFWQKTYYGFTPDSGHALLTPAPAEFTATLSFAGDYDALYDQAGIMLRAGPELWIKAGVEMSDGLAQFSVVITNGQSDWSTTPLASRGPVDLRLTRMGDALFVQYRQGESHYRMARLAPFPADAVAEIGPTACSPKRAGFQARFTDFTLGPLMSRDIH